MFANGVENGDGPLQGVCDPLYPPGSPMFYKTLAATLICVLGAATAAGLTYVAFIEHGGIAVTNEGRINVGWV